MSRASISSVTAAAAVAALAILSGCASSAQPNTNAVASVLYAECDEAAFAAALETGTAQIEGQAFMKTRGGDVKLGAGNEVILVPAISCARTWWDQVGLDWNRKTTVPRSPVFASGLRSTTSDGEGRFKFSGLAPGTYYLRTHVTWEVPSRYGMSLQGGYVGEEIVVGDGEQKSVILTR